MTRNPFEQLDNTDSQQYQDDWEATARRYDALFYGRGSQFRKMVEELNEVNPRASGAYQRLGEIQMASGTHVPWLTLQHASFAAVQVAAEIPKYVDCAVDTLDNFWLGVRLTTIERFHDYINARLEAALWGFRDLGNPDLTERWNDWQGSYCAGVCNAHSLTRSMPTKKRHRERLRLCIDNLHDHLDDLRDLFRTMREITGPGGWWGSQEVNKVLMNSLE